MACIYVATNKTNGKRYVGFAQDLRTRKNVHFCEAFTRNSMLLFHKALRKYGKEGFSWETLCESDDERHLLDIAESEYIRSLNTFHLDGHGYNMTRGGDGPLGYKFTDGQREALRQSHLGKKMKPETIAKIRLAGIGRKNKPSQNAAIALAFSKQWIVTLPNGTTKEVVNLKAFCLENNLRYPAMHRIAKGKMNRHRGHSVRPAEVQG